jgi:hypothetical protein
MKYIALLFSIIIFSSYAYGQNAYYEAQYLNTLNKESLQSILLVPELGLSEHEKTTVTNYIIFLDNPFDTNIVSLDITALQSAIEKNNKILQTGGASAYAAPIALSLLSIIPNLLSGSFSLSPDQQTKIIDGITKYFAEEFQKAQLISYMQTFKSTIGKIGELQVLFPHTYAKLQSADPSRFPALGDEYKAVFNEDLKSILDNFINHIDNYSEPAGSSRDKLFIWLNTTNIATIKSSENYKCFKISEEIGSKLANNYHPVDIFNYIDTKYYDASLLTVARPLMSDYIKLIFHGLNLIQRNLLDTTKKQDSQFANIWLNLQNIQKLDTKDEWLFFAGLIYQQDRDFFDKYIFVATGKNLLSVSTAEITALQKKINNILSALIEIQTFRSNLKEENLNDNFIFYMKLVLKAVESANTFSTASMQIPISDLNKYLIVSDYTLKIYDNIRKKDYNNTMYYTSEILNQLQTLPPAFLTVANTIEQYGNFMTDAINAKNSDETKDVIKKYAAPPSSFILKREYMRCLSITGQPGYFISMEKFDGKNQKFKFVSGITLPIGFEMSFKYKSDKENRASIGIFAQVIDLGAVLNFRTGDSTSTLPDKIEFEQIFSPGLSLNYGFKNSPATIGLGYQYTPELRKITENGNDYYPNGHRIFFRLAWDIPLINIAKSQTK